LLKKNTMIASAIQGLYFTSIFLSIIIASFGASKYLLTDSSFDIAISIYAYWFVVIIFACSTLLGLTNLKKIMTNYSNINFIIKIMVTISFVLCLMFVYDGLKFFLNIPSEEINFVNGITLALFSFALLSFPILFSLRNELYKSVGSTYKRNQA